jgi:hypothetical protein
MFTLGKDKKGTIWHYLLRNTSFNDPQNNREGEGGGGGGGALIDKQWDDIVDLLICL